MPKGRGEQCLSGGAVAAGAKGTCGRALWLWGICAAVMTLPLRTKPASPAAYSARRNAWLPSAGSILVNRRRVEGGAARRPAGPARARRARPRGAPWARHAATAAIASHRHRTPRTPPRPRFRFRQGPGFGCDTAAPAGPRGPRRDLPSGLQPVRRPAFPGAA